MAHRLNPGEFLNHGEQLVAENGRYVLQMQEDGNVVVRMSGNIATWASGTDGHPGAILKMQDDGNLVVIAPGNNPVWSSRTDGRPSCVLFIQDDGNAVVYAEGNRAVWASNSSQPPTFWDPIDVEIPDAVRDRALADPDAAAILGVLECPLTGPGVAICVGAMIAIAILLEYRFGDPPFGPNNDIRVTGGQISQAAKDAGGRLSNYAQDAGGKISKVFKRWF
jgi:hypothetical protein